jgi:hypothetical protein
MILVLTLALMQRGRSYTVTGEAKLPILVPSSSEKQEGFATFQVGDSTPQPVRTFRSEDLKHAGTHLSKTAAQHFTAVMMLKRALENPDDPLALQEATRLLETSERQLAGPSGSTGSRYITSRVISWEPFEKATIWPKWLTDQFPDPHATQKGKLDAHKDPYWLLSTALSNELRDARLVLWWVNQKFRPALWCPDMKTAFYARVLLGVVGGKGFCVCPHCCEWFVQDRPDQTYCSVSHREAHRVARWREQQKLKATKKAKKRRKNVTQKAR